MDNFEQFVTSQSTVGTMTTWTDVIVCIAVVIGIALLMYYAEKMNMRKLLGESAKHARLMKR